MRLLGPLPTHLSGPGFDLVSIDAANGSVEAALAADPEVRRWTFYPPTLDAGALQSRIHRMSLNAARGRSRRFVIRAGPVLFGTAGLGTSATGGIEVFYALLPPARGRGIARDAVRALSALAIRCGAAQVTAEVLEGNDRSSRVLAAAGYRCAGRERDRRDGAVATRWVFLPH